MIDTSCRGCRQGSGQWDLSDSRCSAVGVYLSNCGIKALLPLNVFLLHHSDCLSCLIQGPQVPTRHAARLQNQHLPCWRNSLQTINQTVVFINRIEWYEAPRPAEHWDKQGRATTHSTDLMKQQVPECLRKTVKHGVQYPYPAPVQSWLLCFVPVQVRS